MYVTSRTYVTSRPSVTSVQPVLIYKRFNKRKLDEEPEIILIDGGDDDGEETLITTINLTLTKKEQFRNGQLQSVTRSSPIGYSQNLCENDMTANLQDIFTYVQNEFTEYANYYHDNNN